MRRVPSHMRSIDMCLRTLPCQIHIISNPRERSSELTEPGGHHSVFLQYHCIKRQRPRYPWALKGKKRDVRTFFYTQKTISSDKRWTTRFKENLLHNDFSTFFDEKKGLNKIRKLIF